MIPPCNGFPGVNLLPVMGYQSVALYRLPRIRYELLSFCDLFSYRRPTTARPTVYATILDTFASNLAANAANVAKLIFWSMDDRVTH